MRIASPDRKLLASLAVLVSMAIGANAAHAQFTAPTCTPPNCSPAVIQNIAIGSAAQNASINVSGDAKIGATFQTGAAAPVLSSAGSNLYYGNVGATSSAGALMLLQKGGADRFRVDLSGNETVLGVQSGSAGTAAAPSYTFTSDSNTGIYESAADTFNIATNGISRFQIDSSGNISVPGNLTVTGTITGSGLASAAGTANYVSKFTAGSTLGNSQIYDDGTNIGVGTATTVGKVTVATANSSQADGSSVLYSTNFNNPGVRVGNGGFASMFGEQDANDTVGGGSYGNALGLNAFYNGTNWYTKNGYIQPSTVLVHSGYISFRVDNLAQGGTPGNYTPTERMRIDGTGAVTVPGMTSFGATTLAPVAGQNVLYGLAVGGSAGSLELLQTYSGGTYTDRFRVDTSGNVTASGVFTGNGSGLTNINASNITSGTISSSQLPANVAYTNVNQTFSGVNTFSNASNSFTGSGAGLTALNASQLTSGTVPSGRISGTYSNALTLSGANSYTNRSTFGSASLAVAAGQSLLFGNVASTSAGNLLELQNNSVDKFVVDINGNITTVGSIATTGTITSGGQPVCVLNGTNCPPSAVSSVNAMGAGISVNPTSGAVYVQNTGVTSLIAGAGIGLSGSTGSVTITNTATGIGGSGTSGYVARFTPNGTTLGTSVMQDNGVTVGVGTVPSATGLLVAGPTNLAYAITGTSNYAPNGTGVFGAGLSTTGIGVYGQGGGAGVVGVSSAPGSVGVQATGQLYGVSGTVNTSSGMGVMGTVPSSSTAYGVYGTTPSTSYNSAGVAGLSSNNGMGGYFQANLATSYALLAYNGAGGNAFQAQGSSNFTGPVSMNSTLSVNGATTLTNTLTLGAFASDPAGSNGMSYYNTTTNKFRCFENSAWNNCLGYTDVDTLDTVAARGRQINTYIGISNTGIGASSFDTALTLRGTTTGLSSVVNAGGTAVYGGGGATGVNGSGTSYGGYFGSSAASSYAVYGQQTGTSGVGVYGVDNSSGGMGVYGGGALYGVYGSGGTYGVYGFSNGGYGLFGSSGTGYALYANGRAYVSGDLDAPNNAWGAGSGWLSCGGSAQYCVCPNGSFIGQFFHWANNMTASDIQVYCYKP